MAFEAKYPGWCEDCGNRFGVGDMIEGDPHTGYRHADCGRGEDVPTARICDRCWLVIAPSGACGCEPG